MTGVLTVHKQLVDLLDQLHTGDLDVEGLHPRGSHLDSEAKILYKDDLLISFARSALLLFLLRSLLLFSVRFLLFILLR